MKTYIDKNGQAWLFIPNFGRIAFDDADELRERLKGFGFRQPQNILRNVELVMEPEDIPGDDIDVEGPSVVEEAVDEVEEDLDEEDGE